VQSLEDRIRVAKAYDYTKDYDFDQYVDAKDGLNNWCVGEIKDINRQEQTMKVHFEGWGNRYDEVSLRELLTLADHEAELSESHPLQETHLRVHRPEEERFQVILDKLHNAGPVPKGRTKSDRH
jgi:hypothetical protein